MSEQELPRNLPLLLLQAREAVISNFRPILNYGGVTEQQWRIIRAVHEFDALEPRQICELCQILSPSLAGVLARMEEMGLVKRERVDTDQRRLMVKLTAKSRALVTKLAPLIQEQYRLLEAAMGPALVAEVYPLLDRLVALREKEIPKVALPASGARKAKAAR
jgi:homoprotocatechuate degradation regulator HpaR